MSYIAPTLDEIGLLLTPAYITVMHNGILVQNHAEIKRRIKHVGLPYYEPHGKEPNFLQNHGNAVSFRNIWVREL
ncbi:MAG: family 16 glycoside hydrolase [Tunicatimonas sp.]